MDLNRYVDDLRDQLLIAAEAGGDDARVVAERLVAPLQASTRLVLFEALSAAAGEITSDLAPGSVEVRLRGRDPEFVVTVPATEPAGHQPLIDHTPAIDPTPPVATDGEDGGTSRMTLRLPEPLKVRIEEAAGRDGLSVNAWLVRTLAGATDAATRPSPSHRSATGSPRFTGWTQ